MGVTGASAKVNALDKPYNQGLQQAIVVVPERSIGSSFADEAATFRFAAELENIFHRLFGAAQIDLTIEDRFGHPVKPREWFMVPLQVIDEAVECIRNGSITERVYDLKTARLTSVV